MKILNIIILLLLFSISFGQNATENQPYIMHTVKAGETVYQLSRKYSVPVNEIFKANPAIADGSIKLNQIVRIPNIGNKKTLTNSTPVVSELKPKVAVKEEINKSSTKYHTVAVGQTMYSISKMYNISVENLQKWNNLKDFNLKVGSEIIVSNPTFIPSQNAYKEIPTIDATKVKIPSKQETTENKSLEVNKEEPVKPILETQEIVEEETQKPDIQASDNATQKDLAKIYKEKISVTSTQTAKGTGAPMTTTLGTMETVYFAMHKWLPIGTVIKVKNLVNSKIVYAKVIGKLPDTDENIHVIVRYSLGVKKDLQLQNGKCYLQIEYPN